MKAILYILPINNLPERKRGYKREKKKARKRKRGRKRIGMQLVRCLKISIQVKL